MNEKIVKDTICQVLVEEKSLQLLYKLLYDFLPHREELPSDYLGLSDGLGLSFKSEKELLNYFFSQALTDQTFYWNQYHHNPDHIMLGASLTFDNMMIISLTLDVSEIKAEEYLARLKKLSNSNVGTISYINPVIFDFGEEFIEYCAAN